MQKDISRFEKLGKIILMGDFNARKRNLSDLNYLNQSEFITSLLEDNDPDINMRNSSLTNCHVRDKGVNSYGKSLIVIIPLQYFTNSDWLKKSQHAQCWTLFCCS